MTRPAPLAVWTLLAVAALGAPRARADGDAKPIDLDGVMDALRPLVGDPAWSKAMDPETKEAHESRRDEVPEDRRKVWLAGYQDGRSLDAEILDEPMRPRVVIIALRFDTPENAKAHAATERAVSEAEEANWKKGMQLVSSTWTDGAGPGDKFSGFRVVREMTGPTGGVPFDTVAAILDRVFVMLIVMRAPELDRAAQDEVLARAAAFVKDPAAAKALPAIKPRAHARRPAQLSVHVVDGEGKPIPRASASFGRDDEHRTWLNSVTDGRCEWRAPWFDAPDGEGTVRVWGATDADGASLPWGPAAKEHVSSTAGVVELRMERGLSIDGRVHFAEGPGIGGLTVAAHGEGEPDGANPRSHATTDAQGAFRLLGLDGSEYRVIVSGSARSSAPAPREVRGGTVGLDFLVSPSHPVTITVLDWNGKPVASARVLVYRTEQTSSSLMAQFGTDAAGRAEIRGLDPTADYQLTVDPPAARADLVTFHAGWNEWKPKDETIRLAHGYVVKGVVQDASGKPIHAHVVWRTEHDSGHAVAGDGGRFVLPGVPYGPASVGAVASHEGTIDLDATRWYDVTPEKPEIVVVPGPVKPPPLRLHVEKAEFGQRVWFLSADSAKSDLEVVDPELNVSLWQVDPSLAYTLWIPPEDSDSDLSLLVREWHGPKEDATVSLVPGLEIHGHVRGVPEGADVWLAAIDPGLPDSMCKVMGRVDASGAYRIRGVPPGTWRVVATASAKAGTPGPALSASAEVVAGSSVDLELKPQ